jgi:hypothetical protein
VDVRWPQDAELSSLIDRGRINKEVTFRELVMPSTRMICEVSKVRPISIQKEGSEDRHWQAASVDGTTRRKEK